MSITSAGLALQNEGSKTSSEMIGPVGNSGERCEKCGSKNRQDAPSKTTISIDLTGDAEACLEDRSLAPPCPTIYENLPLALTSANNPFLCGVDCGHTQMLCYHPCNRFRCVHLCGMPPCPGGNFYHNNYLPPQVEQSFISGGNWKAPSSGMPSEPFGPDMSVVNLLPKLSTSRTDDLTAPVFPTDLLAPNYQQTLSEAIPWWNFTCQHSDSLQPKYIEQSSSVVPLQDEFSQSTYGVSEPSPPQQCAVNDQNTVNQAFHMEELSINPSAPPITSTAVGNWLTWQQDQASERLERPRSVPPRQRREAAKQRAREQKENVEDSRRSKRLRPSCA